MEKLIRNANLWNPELSNLIKHIVKSCTTCIKFKNQALDPIVGLPKEKDFNQTVLIDLTNQTQNYGICMVDEISKYSAAAAVSS